MPRKDKAIARYYGWTAGKMLFGGGVRKTPEGEIKIYCYLPGDEQGEVSLQSDGTMLVKSIHSDNVVRMKLLPKARKTLEGMEKLAEQAREGRGVLWNS